MFPLHLPLVQGNPDQKTGRIQIAGVRNVDIDVVGGTA
jgi:hypothetical protein